MRARRALPRGSSAEPPVAGVPAAAQLSVALLVKTADRDPVAAGAQLMPEIDAPAARAVSPHQEKPAALTTVGEPAVASHELALLAREPGDHDVDASQAGAAAVARAAS